METNALDTEQIASICHEANRRYCETIGDTSQVPWKEAPEWQQKSAINGVHFHLDVLMQGGTPSPMASHESWLNEKTKEGWKYGPVKDVEKKEHNCFMPYDQLPLEQRLKDYIFTGIVKAFHDANAKTRVVRDSRHVQS